MQKLVCLTSAFSKLVQSCSSYWSSQGISSNSAVFPNPQKQIFIVAEKTHELKRICWTDTEMLTLHKGEIKANYFLFKFYLLWLKPNLLCYMQFQCWILNIIFNRSVEIITVVVFKRIRINRREEKNRDMGKESYFSEKLDRLNSLILWQK